ncbi:MAG: DedA family protein [Janthinobacterium lividum]
MIEYLTDLGPHVAYLILLLGACIEGESIVLTASFLAYTGFLKIEWVMLIAFMGTLIADQVLFFIGHKHGPDILQRHPKWKDCTEKIFELLKKYDLWFILGFRFIYGIRTLSPLVIGTMGVPVRRFVILNLIAALIWTVISCGLGYMLGYFFADRIEDMIHKIGHYQKIIVISTGVVVIGLVLILWIYKKMTKNTKKVKNLIDPEI